jgi:hypothetical protein
MLEFLGAAGKQLTGKGQKKTIYSTTTAETDFQQMRFPTGGMGFIAR